MSGYKLNPGETFPSKNAMEIPEVFPEPLDDCIMLESFDPLTIRTAPNFKMKIIPVMSVTSSIPMFKVETIVAPAIKEKKTQNALCRFYNVASVPVKESVTSKHVTQIPFTSTT